MVDHEDYLVVNYHHYEVNSDDNDESGDGAKEKGNDDGVGGDNFDILFRAENKGTKMMILMLMM